MIFYKAIKYTILDYCIEKIFDQLSRNLSKPIELDEEGRINFMELEEGAVLSKVVIFVDSDIKNVYGVYKNCTIHSMHQRNNKWWYLEFSYQSIGGNIFNKVFPNVLAKDVHFYA